MNSFLTRQEITREHLIVLENNCKILPGFYRDTEQEFGKKGGKIGDTIFVRKPARAIGRDGQAYSAEPMTDTQAPLTINQQSGVDFEFSSAEKKLSLDEFRNRYLEPYGKALANKLDIRCGLTAMQNTAQIVGTPGTTPGLSASDAFLIYAQAGQKLDEMGFPLVKGDRRMVITPSMRVGFADFAKGNFNPAPVISKMWKKGQVSELLDYDWFVDQNTPVQVIGTLGGTPAVNGAGQTGSTLITDGWTATVAGLMNVGDNFTIAGVYAVNPQSRLSTGSLQDFVIQATASSDGGTNATLTFAPAIVPSGQYQNVSAAPADNALISVYHLAAASQSALSGLSSPQGLLWQKQAFAFASFPGDIPESGADMAFEDRSDDLGASLRFLRIFDGYRDMWINRFDIYYGIAALYAEGACRVCA